MDGDPISVIDLDLDELVISKELSRAFDIIISGTFLLAAFATQYTKIYFTLLGFILFLFRFI
jgi:hypothetical protein